MKFSMDKNFRNSSHEKSKNKFDPIELSKKYESMELTDNQEVAVVGYVFIRQRAEELGLTIADFEPLEVIDNEDHEDHFSETFSDHPTASAVFDHEKNAIGSKHRPDLRLLTHEMTHYFTATENMPNAVENKKRAKSGFNATYFYENSDNTKTAKDSFRYLNEGITDKLAFDLYKNVSEKEIGEVYEKIFPKKAEENKGHSSKRIRESLEQVEKKRENRLLEAKSIIDKNERIKEEKEINESIDSYISRTTAFWKTQSEVHISGDYLKDLKKEEDSTYKPFIDLVDEIIEGIAASKKIAEKGGNMEDLKKNTWADIQKAYFTGNVHYLRIFEKIYGDGFLRKLGTLDEERETAITEFADILDTIATKNKQLRAELENL